MTVDVKYNVGDSVYVTNPYTGKIKLRNIVGWMFRTLKGEDVVLYAFEKDKITDGKDLFWVHESRLFDNIEDAVE